MAFVKTINEDYPVGTVQAMNIVDNDLRNSKYANRERAAVDHNAFANESGQSNLWYHKKVSLIDQATAPLTYAAGGVLYTVSGELTFKDKAANVVPMTSGGQLVIGSNSHMISRGFGLTYKDADGVYVEPGTLYHNITQVNTTARTTLILATGSDWIDGSAPTITSLPIYIYSDVSGNIKLEETAPAYADTAGNTAGEKLYHKEGSTYYRCIGAIAIDSADAIIPFQQVGNEMYFTDPYLDADLQVIDVTANVATFTGVDCSAIVPTFGRTIKLLSYLQAGNNSNANFRATDSGATNGIFISHYHLGLSVNNDIDILDIPCNATPSFDYKATFDAGDFDGFIYGYKMSIR